MTDAAETPDQTDPFFEANPFFEEWTTPFGIPPFHLIRPEHFPPAYQRALAMHRVEVRAIEDDPEPPSFANTIHALEASGEAISRVNGVFWNLVGADTNDRLSEIERDIAPELARHDNAIYMSEALFRRIDALFQTQGTLDLTPEQGRVLHLTHTQFVRAGALLRDAPKARLAAIIERLATLGTSFSQNVLADEKEFVLVLEETDLAGLPDFLLAASAGAATTRGLDGKHVVTLSRSIIELFLQFSTRRSLREQAFAAWTRRGQNDNANNNIATITEMVQLRAERARLLGYRSFSEFKLDDEMAKTPEAARALLDTVWAPAKARAERERADLQALADMEGGEAIEIAPHDWRYYAEKVRRQRHDLDETELKPYLQLDHIIDAAFYVAGRLFGLSFNELHDVPRYQAEVRSFEVIGRDGQHVGVFIGDYFNRPSKRSGAWMSAYRRQNKLDGTTRPIIVNVMNFARAAAGKPTLLSFDDARTLFHEFGHGLHGLLSDVTYPMVAGTSVARDFVEFPSQLYEHWFMEPEILRKFAIHAETGEPLPEPLLEKLLAARNFNQGFHTVEYTSSALVDLDYHALASADNLDPVAFEADTLHRIGMPSAITMRHRSPHFTHIFAGDGYSSGYYSYLWSEVLDADGFQAFVEARDIFDPAAAKRLHDFVYSAGNSRDPVEAYMGFRGHMPAVEPLLAKRGLV